MPKLGEIRGGKELGYKGHGKKLIWQACESCRKERWVLFTKGQPKHKFCKSCCNPKFPKVKSVCQGCGKAFFTYPSRIKWGYGKFCSRTCVNKNQRNKKGEDAPRWKGGRLRSKRGYIEVLITSDDPCYPMSCRKNHTNYILEHRLAMARKLGRCLQPWELVHHKGIRYTGIKNRSDNSVDNLELTTKGNHIREHSKGYRDGYQKGFQEALNRVQASDVIKALSAEVEGKK